MTFEPRGITPEDTVIFVIGCVPFVWAGIEFWRRIAVGDPFGTGSDSVIINDTSGNRTRAVRRVLGQDAIIAARLLFGIAGDPNPNPNPSPNLNRIPVQPQP